MIVTAAVSAGAQNPAHPAGTTAPTAGNGSVRGTITDAQSGLPVDHASVAVRGKHATTIVAGAIVSPSNRFNIQGLRPGQYTLRITSMGFSPVTREIDITQAAPTVDLGAVKLTRVTVSLEQVQVSAVRSAVSNEPDRTTYQSKQVAPAAANASEVLENVPSVQVDADGTVSLRGNTNVVVQINGRPSPLSGTQLGSFLKSLPAGVVDRVEVVPNPSAKYDPDGMVGIINIALKQNADLGLSGGMDASMGPQRYNGSGRVGYQSGPVTVFSTYGYNSSRRDTQGMDNRTQYDDALAASAYMNQFIGGYQRNAGNNLTTTIEYKLNKRDVLTNAVVLNSNTRADVTTTGYANLDGSGSLLDRYDGLRDQSGRGTLFDYDVTFKRTLAPRKHELTLDARFNRSRDEDGTTAWRRDPASAPAAPALSDGQMDRSVGVNRQLTLQGDYTRPLGSMKLESGVKSTTRWLDSDYSFVTDSMNTGMWAPTALSNGIRISETVNAAYGILGVTIGKAELQGGLRGEIADRDFTLTTSSQNVPYRYASLFPSANALYNLSAADQVKLSYSRRIRRPGTQELSPFPVFFGAQNVFFGNPRLSPEYTDAVELGYTRSGSFGSVQLNPFMRHTTNALRFVVNPSDTVAGREVTSVTFRNIATSDSWGTDLIGSMRLGSRVNGFAAVNVFRMVTEGGVSSIPSTTTTTWSARSNASVQVLPTVTLQGSYFYRAPMNFEGGRFLSMQMATLTVRKKLDGDNAAVTFRMTDPFSTQRFRVNGVNGSVRQITERNFGARAAYVGFQYNYGKPPKVRQPEQNQPQGTPGFP
jgi:outer membrane receptor protein involved in Fe transport